MQSLLYTARNRRSEVIEADTCLIHGDLATPPGPWCLRGPKQQYYKWHMVGGGPVTGFT